LCHSRIESPGLALVYHRMKESWQALRAALAWTFDLLT
jgi:hypothetical protein